MPAFDRQIEKGKSSLVPVAAPGFEVEWGVRRAISTLKKRRIRGCDGRKRPSSTGIREMAGIACTRRDAGQCVGVAFFLCD
jgi:hypothetical protein